jgi:hypothetical protein
MSLPFLILGNIAVSALAAIIGIVYLQGNAR